jgi:oxygen-independent coproporphyrinogen-3 oxidase
MAGIYIHIPFCKQACTYCDFHFSTSQKLRQPLIDALCREIDLRKNELSEAPTTLYFGGGSPSILSAEELRQILDALTLAFDLSKLKEVTLESNPDDHSSEKLQLWKSLGINRLSIGIQSFIDRDLKFMNRAHNAQDAQLCVQKAREAGFEKVTIDLIYGIPNQTAEEWKNNIQQAIDLNPEHISAYCLTIEEKTALHHQLETGKIIEKEDEKVEQEYLTLHAMLTQAGYAHYEISNFGKPEHLATHNANYWKGLAYIGFGPSAHSFDGANKRSWNISNNAQYIKAINSGGQFLDEETLSAEDRSNEQIMTGLRRSKGFDLDQLPKEHALLVQQNIHAMDDQLKTCIWQNESHVGIHPEKWLLADAVIREIMIDS